MNITRIGISIKDIGINQESINLLKSVSRVVSTRLDLDVLFFQQTCLRPPIKAPVSIMQERECYGFTGIVIATDLQLGKRLIQSPKPSRKLLYVSELEWLNQGTIYEDVLSTYYNLELIAENDHIYNMLDTYWKTPLGVAENFNFEKMLTLLNL